jgi:hypothetical protein
MNDDAHDQPAVGRSFWLAMIAYAMLLFAICTPLYFVASSFLGDWFTRERVEDPFPFYPPDGAGSTTGSAGITVPQWTTTDEADSE